jgi:putative aminopeptidase FrvX
MIEISKKEKIDIQHESSSRFSGTDTDKIFNSREGIPSALVSIPLRCMHSVVETAHLDDIESTIQLLEAFVLSVKDTDTFHQKLNS